MSGYTRQSVADIIANAVIKSGPVNAEFNALRDAFSFTLGHKHDGSPDEGSYIPLIADTDANNKVVVDTVNNRIGIFVEVGGTFVEQLRIQDGVIVPVTDNDIDLGTSTLEFKNLFIDGTAKIDTLTVDENATVAGTLGVTGLSTLPSVNVDGGTIDGTVIGGSSAQAITGTNITATTGFSGTLTGNVTGNLTGNVTGSVTGNVTGNLTGNVTASTGSSSFNDVTINGSLNMNSGSAGTVTGLSAPVNATDAATKTYVDTADNLKLNLSGGTMSGAIAMGNNKITGLGTPTSTADAATKGYVDTTVANLIDSAPGTLDTLNELAAALGDDPNFATTVTNEIATKVFKAGDTMTGNLVMGANKVTSTATPTTNDDLTRKGYVDTQDALKLNLSGGTMSGAIAMGTNKITGLGDPTANQDAATKVYVDTADALKLNLSGGTMTGNIVMGANKVTSTATPTTDDDLTRKGYVDSILGSATSAAASAAAAAISETNAATSASNALTSEQNAAASYDSFDDRYLGPKASAPTIDNDGDALLTGAIYWNTVSNSLFIWTGSAWSAAVFDTAGALFAANNLSDLSNTATARTNLGVAIGSNVQAWDANLDQIAALAVTDGNFIVGNGSAWVVESGSTARTSLGLGTIATQNSNSVSITGGSITGITDLAVADGGTGASSFTANTVLLGNGTSSFQTVAPGTSGNVLTSNGTTWVSQALDALDTQTATTTSTTPTAIATYATASFDAAKVVVVADNGTDRSVSELLITWKSTTAYATEYAIINTGAAALASYAVDVSGGNFRILATAASATSTSYTVKAITL